MFKLFKNLFKHPYQDLFDAAKAKGHKFYISGGDFEMDTIFSGMTKEETVEAAYQGILASWPDVLNSMKDISDDPKKQEEALRQTLGALMDEIK